jgi:hypothetical protein
MRVPRPTYANVVATVALLLVVGGGALAIAAGEDVNACVRKDGFQNPGLVRIVDPGEACNANEDPATWPSTLDTGQDILNKLSSVDGQGSGLDSSFLDGIDSAGFLRTTGKAADADKLDGVNSTSFVRRGTAATGTIGLSAIGANTCHDVQLSIGGLKVGDLFVLNIAPGDALPARLTMNVLDVPQDARVNVRICNGTNTASVADNNIKVRWYALRP